MSRFGRVVGLLGPSRDEPVPDRFVPPPPRRYDEDAPDKHATIGVDGRIGATELAAVVAETRAGLEPVDAPPGFVWLDLGTIQDLVHRLALQRPGPDAPAISLRFRASGKHIPPDDLWGEHAADVPPGTFLEISPTRAQGTSINVANIPDREHRRDRSHERMEAQRADARELACWMASPPESWRSGTVQRCWKVGTPWPAELESGDPMPLTAAQVRRILREVRTDTEHPSPRTHEAPYLRFDVDDQGEVHCFGPNYPDPSISHYQGRPLDSYLVVPLPTDGRRKVADSPEAVELLEAQLRLVTRLPSGRWVYPERWPWG